MAAGSSVLDEHSFLFKKVLGIPSDREALKFCQQLQKKWITDFSKNSKLKKQMDEFCKTRCMHLVWMSDNFGKSTPEGVSEFKTYQLLQDDYESLLHELSEATDPKLVIDQYVISKKLDTATIDTVHRTNVEKDRQSEYQLKRHLIALLYLFDAARKQVLISVKR